MTMNDSDLKTETRKAIGDIVDHTPMAPDWSTLAVDSLSQAASPVPGVRRGLAVAVGSAVAVVGVVGGIALFGGPSDVIQAEPTTLAPTVTVETSTTTSIQPATTFAPSTTVPIVPERWTDLRDQISFISASQDSLPGYRVTNLIDGSHDTAWNYVASDGSLVELSFVFADPLYVDSIVIVNLQDEVGRLRNFRVKDIEIRSESDPGAVSVKSTVPNSAESHVVEIGAVHQGVLLIKVLSVWPSEAVGDQAPFAELAIAEIEFYGSPPEGYDEARTEALQKELTSILAKAALIELDLARSLELLETATPEVAEELLARIAALEALQVEVLRRTESLREHIADG